MFAVRRKLQNIYEMFNDKKYIWVKSKWQKNGQVREVLKEKLKADLRLELFKIVMKFGMYSHSKFPFY
jgi:hypothetical protein